MEPGGQCVLWMLVIYVKGLGGIHSQVVTHSPISVSGSVLLGVTDSEVDSINFEAFFP